jgi:PAS domain S-box-containing protein
MDAPRRPTARLPPVPTALRRSGRIGVFERDLRSGAGRWDAGMHALYGLDPARGVPPLETTLAWVHEDDRDRVLGLHAELRAGRRDHGDMRFRLHRADGQIVHLRAYLDVHFDAQGAPQLLRGVLIDETDLVAERERVAAQSQRLAAVTDAAGIGTFSRDIDTGALSWSAAQRELYGLLPKDPLPSWSQFLERHVHPEDRARLAAEAEGADANGQAVRHHDFRIRAADGRERWIYAWSGRETREGRRWAYGVHVDVTDRHVAEAERRERERLEQAARAQAALLARVSHELRTPMNAVLGFADVLAGDRGHPLDAVQAERVDKIRHAGRHLLSLIDDLLELAAVDAADRAPQCQPVALATVAAQALPWVTTLAAQSGVAVEAPARLAGTVRADPRALLQVISNLLTNAVKYNRRGGRVWLDSRRRTRGGQRGWVLVVGDNGRGISAEQRARLFQPFERLGAEHEGIAGSGIGLAIVQRLVQRMGGSIDVDSTPGSGSEFRVWLPATGEASPEHAEPVPVPAPNAAPAAAPAAPLAVLCIEDNAVNGALIEALFAMRAQQAVLRIAVDGASGLAMACAEPPDLVLLDMQLPDLHGHEVLRRLRADPRTADCTVIGLSANVLPEDIEAALAAGCDDYWTKPIDVARFLAGIDAQIAQRVALA